MRHSGLVVTILFFMAVSIFLSGCETKPQAVQAIDAESGITAEISEPVSDKKPNTKKIIMKKISEYSESFEAVADEIGFENTKVFSEWIFENFGIETLYDFAAASEEGMITSKTLHKLTGYGVYALSDLYNGRLDSESENYMQNIINLGFTEDGEAELGFVGDVCFGDNLRVMWQYGRNDKGILNILDEELVNIMKSVDIMTANNEFTFSKRGKPIPIKAYTFRAAPWRASIWHEMGVDLVTLANNHSYDFGKDAFLDTLDTLDEAGIVRMGGGRNYEEASRPVYYIINGYKVAFCAATRAEKQLFTPQAKENEPGVMYTYDSENFCREIEEAKSQSDFVIAYVHWGYENTTQLETVQVRMGKEFVDSGADMVIGHHAHTLQGIETYKGKLIYYNLGNFIFGGKSIPTGMVIANISKDGTMTNKFVPCYQNYTHTRLYEGREYDNILEYLRPLSPNIDISDSGEVTPKK